MENGRSFALYLITSPMDAQEPSYIADEDREVFLVMMLNTKKGYRSL